MHFLLFPFFSDNISTFLFIWFVCLFVCSLLLYNLCRVIIIHTHPHLIVVVVVVVIELEVMFSQNVYTVSEDANVVILVLHRCGSFEQEVQLSLTFTDLTARG